MSTRTPVADPRRRHAGASSASSRATTNAQATARRTGQRGKHYKPVIGTAFVRTVVDDCSRYGRSATSPGTGRFTHVAYYQAQIAAADILGQPHAAADYSAGAPLPQVAAQLPPRSGAPLVQTRSRLSSLSSNRCGQDAQRDRAPAVVAQADKCANRWMLGPAVTGQPG
jgi:hypothetical protein